MCIESEEPDVEVNPEFSIPFSSGLSWPSRIGWGKSSNRFFTIRARKFQTNCGPVDFRDRKEKEAEKVEEKVREKVKEKEKADSVDLDFESTNTRNFDQNFKEMDRI